MIYTTATAHRESIVGLVKRMDSNATAHKESMDAIRELITTNATAHMEIITANAAAHREIITTNAAAHRESIDSLGKRMDTNAAVDKLVLEVSHWASSKWIAITTLIVAAAGAIAAVFPYIIRYIPK
jgi:hypothetical protein